MIPIFETYLKGNEKKYLQNCIKSNIISSSGDYVNKFQDSLKKYFEVKYAIAVSSCTAALHIAINSLDIKPGSEILCPALTFISPANMILLSQAKLKLIDVEIDTMNIDPNLIEKNITSKSKAILVVHQFGHAAKMDKIKKIANKYSLKIIEDNAESFGGKFKRKFLGTLGDVGTLSFFGNKFITTGEGGALITNNKSIANKCKILRDHGMDPHIRYKHIVLGYNYRMTNLQAAIGYAQMENIKKIREIRLKQMQLYYKILSNNSNFYCRVFLDWCEPVHWLMTLILKNKLQKNKFINFMKKNGVECRTMIKPVNAAKHINDKNSSDDFPVAKYISSHSVHLPSGSNLTRKQLIYICNLTLKFFN